MVILHEFDICGEDHARLFSRDGFAMDFIRVKVWRRGVGIPSPPDAKDLGGPSNIMRGWNEYLFRREEGYGFDELNLLVKEWELC